MYNYDELLENLPDARRRRRLDALLPPPRQKTAPAPVQIVYRPEPQPLMAAPPPPPMMMPMPAARRDDENELAQGIGGTLGRRGMEYLMGRLFPPTTGAAGSAVGGAMAGALRGLRHGGTLRRGESVIVGEDGEEMVINDGKRTHVVPLPRSPDNLPALSRQPVVAHEAEQLPVYAPAPPVLAPPVKPLVYAPAPPATRLNLFGVESPAEGEALPLPVYRPAQMPSLPPPLVPRDELQRKLADVGEVPAGSSHIATAPVPADAEGKPMIRYDPGQATRSARFADPAGRLEKQIDYERQHPAENRNSRLKGALKSLLYGVANADPQGGLASMLGSGLGTMAVGAVHKPLDERMEQAQRTGGYQRQLKDVRGREAERLKLEGARSEIRLRDSQTGFNLRRPDLEAEKALAKAKAVERRAVMSEITNRLKEPRPFDPEDPYDGDLLERATEAGVHFSPGIFGDYQNPPVMEIMDPTDPKGIRKTKRFYDRSKGAWFPVVDSVTQQPVVSGRVQPVSEVSGMTPAQEGTAKRGAEALRLSRERLNLSERDYDRRLLEGMNRQALNTFRIKTEGLRPELNQLRKDIETWKKRKAEGSVRAAHADAEIESLTTRAAAIDGQLQAARAEVLGAAPSQGGAAGAGAAVGGAAKGKRTTYTEAQVRKWARDSGRDEGQAVEEARKKGLLP